MIMILTSRTQKDRLMRENLRVGKSISTVCEYISTNIISCTQDERKS